MKRYEVELLERLRESVPSHWIVSKEGTNKTVSALTRQLRGSPPTPMSRPDLRTRSGAAAQPYSPLNPDWLAIFPIA